MEYEPTYSEYMEDRAQQQEAKNENAQNTIDNARFDYNKEQPCAEWNGKSYDYTSCESSANANWATPVNIVFSSILALIVIILVTKYILSCRKKRK